MILVGSVSRFYLHILNPHYVCLDSKNPGFEDFLPQMMTQACSFCRFFEFYFRN